MLYGAECLRWLAALRPLLINELHRLSAHIDQTVNCLVLHFEDIFELLHFLHRQLFVFKMVFY